MGQIRPPRELFDFARQLAERGKRCFLVGGALRDYLLGREANDFDVATDARPEEDSPRLQARHPHGHQARHRHGPLQGPRDRGHDLQDRVGLRRRQASRHGRVRLDHRGGPLAPRLHDQRDGLRSCDEAAHRPPRRPRRPRPPPRARRGRPDRALPRGRPPAPSRHPLRRPARLRRRGRGRRPRSRPSIDRFRMVSAERVRDELQKILLSPPSLARASGSSRRPACSRRYARARRVPRRRPAGDACLRRARSSVRLRRRVRRRNFRFAWPPSSTTSASLRPRSSARRRAYLL